MDDESYFKWLEEEFGRAYEIASSARAKGFDPHDFVEIKVAPDLSGKVEALIGVKGIGELILKNQVEGKSRGELAFNVIKEICTSDSFSAYETIARMELAVRTGLGILTDGVLVAPTEGMQRIEHYKNSDNSDYIAVLYAGPIRSAGGTAVALSVAFADYARKFFDIGAYKATHEEVERYIEELESYHAIVRLQYKPSPDEIRTIVTNCGVCVDGVPTEDREVSVHTNIVRKSFGGKEVMIPNRIRGGVPLVVSSIAQKAKSVLRDVKKVELDWNWLNNIITIPKKPAEGAKDETAVFLEELVAGRPILAYPKHIGGFRLRYGRSRMTGIAAKGFSPATMIIALGFIATGTQLKVELPGKGCIAAPVDSIEGPFVRLKSGECLRVNDAEVAQSLKDDVVEIISLGDILITYGDFRKTNTKLQPSSYVEEFWQAQLEDAAKEKMNVDHASLTFKDAFGLSLKYGTPLHPRFLFEFQAVKTEELEQLAKAVATALGDADSLFTIDTLEIDSGNDYEVKHILEKLNVPHRQQEKRSVVSGEFAQSLAASLGFAGAGGELKEREGVLALYRSEYADALALVNTLAPFKLMKRSTFIGARIGRPEKAKERLMKPAPNVLFPISTFGGKGRNVSSAYAYDSKKFGRNNIKVEMARYVCDSCGAQLDGPYCYRCNKHASINKVCTKCNLMQRGDKCERCGSETVAYAEKEIDLVSLVAHATAKLGGMKLPKMVKGVKGMFNRYKIAEPLEKGILRAAYSVYTFKDGTARFDATDAPLTHFYPAEMGVSFEKLRSLGYDKDAYGNELKGDDQLVEMKHQDVILNRRGAEYLLSISKFVDDLLRLLYGIKPYYNMNSAQDLVGQLVLTLAPHTSCAVLNRIVGFTDATVGFAHPYTICARRRNADGDEDTTMLLLDALINFSKDYLPTNIGGTMDEPLLLTTRVFPEEVDDEVHAMEVVESFPLEFYKKTLEIASPSDVQIELVENRLRKPNAFRDLRFTHGSSATAIKLAPKRSIYTQLKTMDEKIDAEFKLMDMLASIDKRDAARRLIMSHFMRDMIGNLHSYSKQRFRCGSCNAKFRRVPLGGKCTKDGGKLLLTISKGSIEKYLNTATKLADRYDLDVYTKQRIMLVRSEIDNLFGSLDINVEENKGQFNLTNFL